MRPSDSSEKNFASHLSKNVSLDDFRDYLNKGVLCHWWQKGWICSDPPPPPPRKDMQHVINNNSNDISITKFRNESTVKWPAVCINVVELLASTPELNGCCTGHGHT